jgi:phosphoribosylformylglycinamidine synthase
VLLGSDSPWDGVAGLAGSEYASVFHNTAAGQPVIDLDLEARVQAVCRDAVRAGLLSSAHDCSEGGLAVAVAESAVTGRLGGKLDTPLPHRWDAALFGESQSRIVVSLPEASLGALERMAGERNVPWVRLGTVGGAALDFGGATVTLADASDAWLNGFERATSG